MKQNFSIHGFELSKKISDKFDFNYKFVSPILVSISSLTNQKFLPEFNLSMPIILLLIYYLTDPTAPSLPTAYSWVTWKNHWMEPKGSPCSRKRFSWITGDSFFMRTTTCLTLLIANLSNSSRQEFPKKFSKMRQKFPLNSMKNLMLLWDWNIWAFGLSFYWSCFWYVSLFLRVNMFGIKLAWSNDRCKKVWL